MRLLDWVAAIVLFLQLPVPLYWLILHPQVRFWRRHGRAVYWVAVLSSWGAVLAFLLLFHRRLLASTNSPTWAIIAGLALLLLELYLFYRAERDLGSRRLVGQAELAGSGELARTGIYAYLRHPRYAGSMLAVLGACLVAGTRVVWIVGGVWWLLLLTMIRLEERELGARFGAAFVDYRRRVPAFLPFRFRPRKE